MIKVNGEELLINEEISLADLLKRQGYKTLYVAIELNGRIVRRENFDNTVLKNGDVLEVVNFVGGG